MLNIACMIPLKNQIMIKLLHNMFNYIDKWSIDALQIEQSLWTIFQVQQTLYSHLCIKKHYHHHPHILALLASHLSRLLSLEFYPKFLCGGGGVVVQIQMFSRKHSLNLNVNFFSIFLLCSYWTIVLLSWLLSVVIFIFYVILVIYIYIYIFFFLKIYILVIFVRRDGISYSL